MGAAGVVGPVGFTRATGNVAGSGTDTDEQVTDSVSRQDVQTGGELIATFGADVANFDPTQINDTTSSKAFGRVYETLLSTDFEGQPQPHLAESVEQTGDLTFQVSLREGITFHNGDSLTAEDVQVSFERYEGTPREADVFDWYESSTVVDDLTIDFELSRPFGPFRDRLDGIPVVPKAVEQGDLDLTSNPIGTGPYQFVEHQPDSLFRIERNEDYWFEGNDTLPASPPIDTVTYRVITEQSAQLAALQGGDVDFINNPPASAISDLKSNSDFNVGERLTGGYDFFSYPMNEAAETPFQNRNVRLGVNRLIPRDAIVETVYNNIGQPAFAPISPLLEEFSPESFQQELKEEFSGFDREQATALLEDGFSEAGFDRPFETTIVTNQNPQRVQWSQLIQESMNQTEFFDVSLEQFEFNTFVGNVLSEDSHTKNQIVSLGWSAGWDPNAYVQNLFHSNQFTPNCCNINHFQSDTVDNLIDQGIETLDAEERQSIYEELQREVVRQSPMAFIRFGLAQNAMTADVVNNFQTYPIDGAEYKSVFDPSSNSFTWLNK